MGACGFGGLADWIQRVNDYKIYLFLQYAHIFKFIRLNL